MQTADGTGYTIYSNAFLLVMVPHSVVTVSLATAILPRLSASAADADLAGLARTLSTTLRTTLVLIVPIALHPAGRVPRISKVVWAHGAAAAIVRELRPVPGPVRARTGVLQRPLPDAARLLRARAHPHCLLGPVRGRRHQHRAGPRARPTGVRRGDLTRPGARLRRGPTSSVRRCRTSCCGTCWAGSTRPCSCGSWCGC